VIEVAHFFDRINNHLRNMPKTKNTTPRTREQPSIQQPVIQDTFIREARVNYLHCDHVMFKIAGPADVANFVRSILTDNSREHFVALYLNASHQVAAYSIVSIGSANSAPVAPREVFQRAVLTGAISIVLAHNHPSDSTEPSNEDRAVTKRLRDAGQLLGIKVLDHLIVTDSAYLSLKDDEGW